MPIRSVSALLLVASLSAVAQVMPAPENVVNLGATASVEVPMDRLGVVFSTTREGPEAAAVQVQLKQALDAALDEARKAARPGELEVRTGAFSLRPRHLPKGGTSGWIGHAELIVEGTDMPAIARLTGRIQTMSIARVGHSLSREKREKVEAEVAAQAIERFRTKAAQTARLFGFTGYLLREVHVHGDTPQHPAPMEFAKARMSSAAMAEEALPTEAGKATVSAAVNGSVQLTR
jgi:predicted secreted protein